MDKLNADTGDLAEYIFTNLQKSKKPYKQPTHFVLSNLFRRLYFASMNSEEGQLIRVRVAFYDPEEIEFSRRTKSFDRWSYIPFDKPRRFDIKTIVKLSKSVDPWSGSLAVYYDEDDELWIFGLIDQAVHAESYLNRETSTKPDQAGLFQVSITGIGCLSVIRDYDLVATLKQNVLATEFVDVLRFGPISRLLKQKTAGLKHEIQEYVRERELKYTINEYETLVDNTVRDTISRLLIHIRNYHHGGALLITKDIGDLKINYGLGYNRLRTAIVRLVKTTIACNEYASDISEAYIDGISVELFEDFIASQDKKKAAENELKGAIRFVASHSCVDGLILLNDELQETGYGVVVRNIEAPKYIYHAQDNLGTAAKLERKSPAHYGTRHQSMISFCSHNPEAIGFVISQDGDIRAFQHVDERLLMWENIKTHKYLRPSPFKKTVPLKKP